jgi:hypothetical protein
MAYASTAVRNPKIRIPHIAMPKWQWPSPRTRALLMIALMFSPAVLSDSIGYCVQRIFYTSQQIDQRQSPVGFLAKIRMFDVACPAPNAPAQETQSWGRYAAGQGWPLYLQAGVGCFRPNRNLRGVAPLKVFTVACPNAPLTASEHHHWLVYVADHKWTPYTQAGVGCVDPECAQVPCEAGGDNQPASCTHDFLGLLIEGNKHASRSTARCGA